MHTTYTRFVAYGSETYLPLLGELKVMMRNVRGKEIATTVYVIESQGESLLGKEDARALGILSTDRFYLPVLLPVSVLITVKCLIPLMICTLF